MEEDWGICFIFVVLCVNSDFYLRLALVRRGGEVGLDLKQSQQPDSAITVYGIGWLENEKWGWKVGVSGQGAVAELISTGRDGLEHGGWADEM